MKKKLLPIILLFSQLISAEAQKQTEPYNILWLVCEDMGAYIPPFGDSTIQTPNLSRLASEGVLYPNLYSTSGVCAPSRFAIITGMYPSGAGANHMRTSSYPKVSGEPPYEAVPPPQVKMFSELLREAGYYCSNNNKKDYQFKAPVTAWDESSSHAHWRNRAPNQPFFSIFNFVTTHESGLFEPYGIRKGEFRFYKAGDRSVKPAAWDAKTSGDETPVHVSKDTKFPVPPYLPDNEVIQRDMWKMYNNIAEMDKQLGVILEQLEADNLLDKTIIFFYADHGGPLPRQKRLIYDSGLNAPLIIRFPNKENAGTIDDQLISFVDMAPTMLALAQQTLPDYLQGRAFLNNSQPKRKYIHAAADRFDEVTDVIRAVRDERFKYVRNYRPQQSYYLPLSYRERIPTMKELLRLRDNGQLNEIQAQWFRPQKDSLELFDCLSDPYELHNLANDPKYSNKLKELSEEMDRWLRKIGDQPNLPENELVKQLWGGEEAQPKTAKPSIKARNSEITITCSTKGASIGYRVISDQVESPNHWRVYQKPFQVKKGTKLQIQAHRIGFKPSDTIEYKLP